MYLLDFNAVVSDERLAAVRPAHSEWVNEGFKKNLFIFAGPKTKTAGGFILAKNMQREELDQYIATDPYIVESVATFAVSEFEIKVTADGFEKLKG